MPVREAIANTFTGSLINLQLVMIDRSGLLWSGTSGLGLNKYNLATGRFNHFFPHFSVRNILPVAKDMLASEAGKMISGLQQRVNFSKIRYLMNWWPTGI